LEIVRSIRYVDAAIPQETMDKLEAWKKIRFDLMFVGDDWYGTESWRELERKFAEFGVRVVYFPYTKGTSSTLLNDILVKIRDGKASEVSQQKTESVAGPDAK
jgi:glycerol-3-phosphate cytidylyltransferase